MSDKSFRKILDEIMVDTKKDPQRVERSVCPQAHLRMLRVDTPKANKQDLRMLRVDTPKANKQDTLSQLDTRIPIIMKDRPALTDREVKSALSLYEKDIVDLEERELELYL